MGKQMDGQFYKQRLDFIDVFRGCGIILMVMGHIGFGSKFDHFIHAFHMPMFFFISGYFYKSSAYKIGEYACKKAKTLLIPYFSFGLAHYFVYILFDGLSIKPLLHLMTINTDGLPIAGALWFLTALFFTDMIYYFLDKWNVRWLILPLVLIGSFSDQILPYALPWALSASFVGLGLYWFGEMTKKYESRLQYLLNMNWWQILIAGMITTALIFVNGYINMREGRYAFLPLFWINAILSIFIGISISKIFCRMEKCNWLINIGERSIVYVCCNQAVIRLFCGIVSYLPVPLLVSRLLILIMSMMILHWLSLLFTETKLRFFIGK